MEEVARLVNKIRELCPQGSTIYLSYNPVEFHILDKETFYKCFEIYQASPCNSDIYPIELSAILNGVKFFTLTDAEGWYPDAAN